MAARYASPLPFEFGWVLNDTEARALHLGLGLFLAFLCFPLLKSQRGAIPFYDWIVAIAGAFAGAYFLLFTTSRDAARPAPRSRTSSSLRSASCCLEATRRAVGLPMTILALLFLAYIMLGRYRPT